MAITARVSFPGTVDGMGITWERTPSGIAIESERRSRYFPYDSSNNSEFGKKKTSLGIGGHPPFDGCECVDRSGPDGS